VFAGGDRVTIGSSPSGTGGSLAGVRGGISVQSYGPAEFVVDDSGSTDPTPKHITLWQFLAGTTPVNRIEGLTATPITWWSLAGGSTFTVRGGAADETFAISGVAGPEALRIDGGGGTNTLDYSGYDPAAGGVMVNLRPDVGTATGVGRGIANIRNVVGSAGDDILVGSILPSDGGHVLTGGAGRDLLIAGPTASMLFGGDGEDLLIGGTSTHDANPSALDAVMAEWARTDRDLDARLAALRAGLLGDDYVQANGGRNGLFGGAAADALFGTVGVDSTEPDLSDEFVPL
jgi:hypothetical protein